MGFLQLEVDWRFCHSKSRTRGCPDLDPAAAILIVGRRVDLQYHNMDRPRLRSWDEVMKLAEALDGSVKTAYLLSARAGLRPAEAVALIWSDVDLEGRQIRVSKQISAGDDGPTRSDVPRTVPIVEVLARHLAAIRPIPRADNALVCPPPRRKKKNGTRGAYRGTHLGEKSIRAALARAFRATGIPPADFYDYGRHTFASLAALGGAPAWRLREVLGHADIERTLQYVSLRNPPPRAAEPTALRA
jgi:integrase